MDWERTVDRWPDLVTRTTLEGVYTYVSAASRTLVGFAPEEMLGRHAADFMHPSEVADLVRHNAELRRSGRALSTTVRIRCADGHYTWLETLAVVIDVEGRSEVLATSRDVTDRVDREHHLAAAEARYRALLDTLPDGVLLLGPDGTVDSVNRAAEHLLDRSAAALVGRLLPPELDLAPHDADAPAAAVAGTVPWTGRDGVTSRRLLVRRQPLRRHGERTAIAVAVLIAAADGEPAEPAVAGWPAAAPAMRVAGFPSGLTPREREVLVLLADGAGVREIADQLRVQVSTVRGYIKAILGKLGVHSQLQAVVLAARRGLLPERPPAG